MLNPGLGFVESDIVQREHTLDARIIHCGLVVVEYFVPDCITATTVLVCNGGSVHCTWLPVLAFSPGGNRNQLSVKTHNLMPCEREDQRPNPAWRERRPAMVAKPPFTPISHLFLGLAGKA